MKIIGVTGNSGSGKTTIAQIIANKYNMKIIDADKIVKQLSVKGEKYFVEIIKKFGKGIVDELGNLKRKELAEIIFSNEKKRKELNKTTQKYVVKEIKKQMKDLLNENGIVLDVPLLFESKLNKKCDLTIAVLANEDTKINRICKRDKITKEEAKRRINAQTNEKYLAQKADYLITNNADISNIIDSIDKINFLRKKKCI